MRVTLVFCDIFLCMDRILNISYRINCWKKILQDLVYRICDANILHALSNQKEYFSHWTHKGWINENIFVTIINKLWSILHSMKLSELDIVSY